MNTLDRKYLENIKNILDNGELVENRTGIDTYRIFNQNLKIDMSEGFPLLTTKKVFLRGVFEEMQMFLRGETNSKTLEAKKVNIWKGNTSREFLDNRKLFDLPEGDIGCSYSHQFRNYGGEHPHLLETKGLFGYDQLKEAVNLIKNDPYSRRIIINLWNPNQLDLMALPPCHLYCQFLVNIKNNTLDLFWLQRSADEFLGKPFNIVQYALFGMYISKLFGLEFRYLSNTTVDSHLYINHKSQAELQLSRLGSEYELPLLKINKSINSLDDILNLQFTDLELLDYKYHPIIEAPMAI